MKILLLEDEKALAAFIISGLKAEGFTIEWTQNGTEALTLAAENPYDALILDIMVPGRDGLSILRHLRQAGHSLPIVLISARTSLHERLEGLQLGADDYLCKPFSVEELAVRLRNIQRRTAGAGHAILTHGDLSINFMTREVKRGHNPITLTPREFDLLVFLTRNPDRVRTRTQILEHVWEYHHEPGTNVVDVCIRRLRAKLEPPGGPALILTIRSVGYCLAPA
jgi:two-component system, OmpR family, response regulator